MVGGQTGHARYTVVLLKMLPSNLGFLKLIILNNDNDDDDDAENDDSSHNMNSTYVDPGEEKKDEATTEPKKGNKKIQTNKEKTNQDEPMREIGMMMVRWLNLVSCCSNW